MRRDSSLVLILIYLFLAWIFLCNYQILHIFFTPFRLGNNSSQNLYDQNLSYCDSNGNWSSIDGKIYFKKEASFYFYDLNLITLNFLHSKIIKPKFQMEILVEYNGKQLKVSLEKFNLKKMRSDRIDDTFVYSVIDCELNLNDYLPTNEINLDKLKLTLNITELNMNKFIRKPLILRIHKTESASKKNSMICSKVIFLEDKNKIKDLKFWIDLNRLSGYKKILLYNKQEEVENRELEELLKKEQDFVQVKNLVCLPNLIRDNLNFSFEYFEKYKEIRLLKRKMDLISTILINECYLENLDKFSYIQVADIDELILPRSNTSREFNFESFNNSFEVDLDTRELDSSVYFNRLFWDKKETLLFLYNMYFGNEMMNKFCKAFKNEGEIRIKNDEDSLNQVICIKVKGKQEVDYANALCKLNYNLVEPFLTKNKEKLTQVTNNFGRFFMLRVGSTGKSIHNTNKTYRFLSHFAWHEYPFDLSNIQHLKISKVQYESGFTSHFRYTINVFSKQVFSIRDISFDWTYFSHYFKNAFNAN